MDICIRSGHRCAPLRKAAGSDVKRSLHNRNRIRIWRPLRRDPNGRLTFHSRLAEVSLQVVAGTTTSSRQTDLLDLMFLMFTAGFLVYCFAVPFCWLPSLQYCYARTSTRTYTPHCTSTVLVQCLRCGGTRRVVNPVGGR